MCEFFFLFASVWPILKGCEFRHTTQIIHGMSLGSKLVTDN